MAAHPGAEEWRLVPDIISLPAEAGCAILLGFVAGLLILRRRQRREIEALCTLHKRQIGLSAQRLAEAHGRLDAFRKEVLMLKKEVMQHQTRWRRANAALTGGIEAVAARPLPPVQRIDERSDDGSGFPHTQPWERGSA
ncbi:MAG TPA: hypothetical protein VIP05_01785 [Burkholderiaceae bacterium]